MYFLLTLFFASLLGIVLMVGQKLWVSQNGEILKEEEEIFPATPHLELWRQAAAAKMRRYSYTILVIIIRIYVKSSNFLKHKYQELKDKLGRMYAQKLNGNLAEKKEASKFLRMISDYKQKIGRIKEKIKEEEKTTPP